MTETRFKKSIAGTFATGIILEKELSTEEVYNELIKLEKENEQLKSDLSETKEVLMNIERDRNQTLLVCKKYEGFFKEKGYDFQDLIDFARNGEND